MCVFLPRPAAYTVQERSAAGGMAYGRTGDQKAERGGAGGAAAGRARRRRGGGPQGGADRGQRGLPGALPGDPGLWQGRDSCGRRGLGFADPGAESGDQGHAGGGAAHLWRGDLPDAGVKGAGP